MTRYFFVVLLMGLVGIAIVVKGAMIMFAERQYWHDVADRFVKENVTVKPNRGNILSSDGKLMASSLPEYKIYMDFMSGERDEKRRKKDQQRKDSIWKANFDSICIGLHQIFPDISAATFKSHLRKGREMKSRNYNILPNRNRRISYIQYKEAKRLPVFKMNKYRGGFHEQIYNQRKKPFGSLAAQTLGRLYADTAMGARNGIELAFDTLLKGRNGITHRQKVMNKYLNIVDLPPVDGCDIISTLDVGMQDICEKALVDKLKEINANVGVAVLMEVATGEVKAIVNMMKAGEMNEALLVLNDLKVPVQKQFAGQKKKEQWGHTQAAPSAVILQDQEPASGTVPSVVGMGAKDAVYLLESKGLKVRLNGVGRVRNQSIASGSRIVKGQTIALTLR